MPKIKERLNQQTTKHGILALLMGMGLFPDDVNLDMIISMATDWMDITTALVGEVGVAGAAAVALVGIALRWIGVNRDRV